METLELKHGDRVRCIIEGKPVEEGKIAIDGKGYIWICNNEVFSVNGPPETFGYKYSTLYSLKGSSAKSTHVTDLIVLDGTPIEEQKPEVVSEQGTVVKSPAQELADIITNKFPPDKISMALNLIKTLT